MLHQSTKMLHLNKLLSHQSRAVTLFLTNFRNISITTVPMPSLSPTMTHGSISLWNKSPGDSLSPGDVLCEIETDKASVGFEVQDDGVLAKILIEANGGEVECGRPIALTVEDKDDYATFLTLPESEYGISDATHSESNDAPTKEAPPADVSTSTTSSSDVGTDRRLSPAARHMVETQGIDITKVQGSSKGGLVTKADVILGMKSGAAVKTEGSVIQRSPPPPSSAQVASPSPTTTGVQPAPSAEATVTTNIGGTYTDIKNSNMRKVIAKRLTESKTTVPHHYTAAECEIDELLALRKTLKNDFGVNVSVNDLVIKAAAMALRDVPECNGRWAAKTESAELNDTIDISVAVATPSGLITPIVFNADRLGLSGINKTVLDLATRARDGKLKPEEYQGGTFTISNLGMFGITSFNAVINPPQACILAVSGGVARVKPPKVLGAEGPDGKPRIVTTMTVQLSSDRRVVDEAIAALFCQVFRNYLNNPKLIML